MAVETFEIEELDETQAPEAMEAEALELIKDMGLEGQQSLTHAKKEDGSDLKRNPYPLMNQEQSVVYKAVYPVATPIEKYDSGIIPLRVLQVARHAQSLDLVVKVWHAKKYNPDPLLVGHQGSGSSEKFFLLARWGEALAPWAEMLKAAREAIRTKLETEARSVVARGQAVLNDLEGHVERKLQGEWFYL